MNASDAARALGTFRAMKARCSVDGAAQALARESKAPLDAAERFVRRIVAMSESEFLAGLAVPKETSDSTKRLSVTGAAQHMRAGLSEAGDVTLGDVEGWIACGSARQAGVSCAYEDGMWLFGF